MSRAVGGADTSSQSPSYPFTQIRAKLAVSISIVQSQMRLTTTSLQTLLKPLGTDMGGRHGKRGEGGGWKWGRRRGKPCQGLRVGSWALTERKMLGRGHGDTWFPGFFPSPWDRVCVTQVTYSLHSESQFGYQRSHPPAAGAEPDPDLGEPL